MEKVRFFSFLQAFRDPIFKFQNTYSGECKGKEFAYIIVVFFYIPKRSTVINVCLDAQGFQLIVDHIQSLETFLPPALFLKKKQKTHKK